MVDLTGLLVAGLNVVAVELHQNNSSSSDVGIDFTMAPAVAARGLPVIAIQCLPCSGGFWVCWAEAESRVPPSTSRVKRYLIDQVVSK